MTTYVFNDGGRAAAGFKGKAGDCCARSIAIATGLPYQEVYDEINELAKGEKITKRKKSISNARTGVYRETAHKFLAARGWVWVPTMTIGLKQKVHLDAAELPTGMLVLRLAHHFSVLKDGVIHDTFDPRRPMIETTPTNPEPRQIETRLVYGYWHKPV